ncbi:chitobiase/beta-hexosaminidase C-terminal domain-containing protein [Serratia ureilytica]
MPGARVAGGKLEANIALPGLGIEYSTDGGKQWQRYDAKAKPAVSGDVQVRSVSPDGKRYSRAERFKPGATVSLTAAARALTECVRPRVSA